jgi:hypothetical protein
MHSLEPLEMGMSHVPFASDFLTEEAKIFLAKAN